MRCSSCNHDNRTDRRFCTECGATLSVACPSCGAPAEVGEKFCGGCGVRLPTVAPAPGAPTPTREPEAALPAGERRQLTVLFCDLVGSTPLSQQLDAEEWRDLIAQYQQAAAGAVARWGGHVARHLGDGLLIYFGWPTAREDDPERAVRAGLAILDAMAPLSATLSAGSGTRLAVRIGMHTGPVVIADGGEVFGETANVAARVQGAAEPDTVVITAATQRLVAGLFVVEDRGPQALKGVREPVTLYRVVQPSGVRSRLDVARAHGFTPFVGREDELRLLRKRWEQAHAGEGQVVLITGEAGIGKSRLVQMLKEHLANEPHTWVECVGSPYHQNTPFYAVVDLLQQVLAWRGDESVEARSTRLEQGLTLAGVPLTEAVPLIAPLLGLPVPAQYPPLDLSPEGQRKKLLGTLSAWLVGLARVQPAVAVLEDLHWVDPSTLELQALLVESAATAPLLILYTGRPEFHPPWPLHGHHAVLTLNRLAPRQIRELIAGVAARVTLAPEVIETVITRTDGVPLFIEELTKAVLEGQGSASARMIPMTLEDSLRARLDRLGPAREVAQLGAVIGREFSYALAHAVSPLSEVDLQSALTQLTEAELLYARGQPPAAHYVFKHALVQDAAYASLLKTRRRAQHHAIATALTDKFPETVETQPEVLAHHYTEAGDTEPAVAAWQQAAAQAAARSAHEEALRHLRQALALLANLPESTERHAREIALQFALVQSLIQVGGFGHGEIEPALQRARALSEAVGDRVQLGWALDGLANYYTNRGQPDRAIALAEQVLEIARQTDVDALVWAGNFQLCMAEYKRGNFASSLAYNERMAATYGASWVRVLGLWLWYYSAWDLWVLGYPDRALQRAREVVAAARTFARTLMNPFSLALALSGEAVVHGWRRDSASQKEVAERLIVLSEAQGFRALLGQGKAFHGLALAAAGAGAAALATVSDGLVLAPPTGNPSGAPMMLELLATVQRAAGQHADALATLEMALVISEQTGQHYWDAELHRLKGEITLVDSEQSRVESEKIAEECFRRALEIARGQDAKSLELRAATSLARLWQRQGKRDAARDLLAPLYAWFTEGFDTRDLQDAKALLEELR
jgi:class 3 adenylate cyclase/tetratricopeptide (TPR) repeat protein/energy-coupling factor transporter ATP-binding protein EcfA2